MSELVITFNELRRIKDELPSGSTARIAKELGIDADSVRNYFGGKHKNATSNIGTNYEQGPDGGMVNLSDTTILDCAIKILNESRKST